MSYIGNPIISTDFPKDTFSGNGSTTAFTMSIAPASVNAVIVVVSGITQDPSTYTISGTTLTFSGAPPTGTSNISVRHLGNAGTPNVAALASVGPTQLSATGTASSSTYLRGDNTWATVTSNPGTVTSVSGTGTVSGLSLSGTVTSSGNLTLGGTLSVARSNLPTGSVLQVVSVNDTTQYVFNSGSSNQTTYYNISGMVASITPISSSSKILLIANITAGQANNTYNAFFRAQRNGTTIGVGVAGSYPGTATTAMRTSDGGEIGTNMITYLDSPSSTSAVSYQIQICNAGGSGSPSYVNRPQNSSTGWEQSGASSIILMEIAG